MKLSVLSVGAVIPDIENDWANNLPKELKRRKPKVWQLGYVAASRALAQVEVKPTAIISAAPLGALNETISFFTKFADTGLGAPRHFIASVHNSMAGKLAVDFGIKGANLTFCDSHNSLSSALIASTLIKDEVTLLVIAEEYLEILDEIYLRTEKSEVISDDPKEGAVALLLSKKEIDGAVRISATPPRPEESKGIEDRSFFQSANKLLNAIESKMECTIYSYSLSSEASSSITVSL